MFILEIVALNDNDHVLGEVCLSCQDSAQIDAAIAHTHRFVIDNDDRLICGVARESATKMRVEVEYPRPWAMLFDGKAKEESFFATLSTTFTFCNVEHLQVDDNSVVARLRFEIATFEELELAMQDRR